MRNKTILCMLLATWLVACTTPYSPSVVAHGAKPFPGIVGLIGASQGRVVDVVLVHGMCTHDAAWATGRVDMLVKALDESAAPLTEASLGELAPSAGIQILERVAHVAGGTIHFTALIWSPLTARLKSQLAFDSTGAPTDCSQPGECKPRRATLNGSFKDGLLNDCLADALIYQGQSRAEIQSRMVNVLTNVLGRSTIGESGTRLPPRALVVISESLGSKIAFDALDAMVNDRDSTDQARTVGSDAIARLATIYMVANQLPMLSLADQEISHLSTGLYGAPPAADDDALARILRRAGSDPGVQSDGSRQLKSVSLVAFTDPNDLLSYRLQASRYASLGISIADVLVSNAPTYLGLLELPDIAHTTYMLNSEVAKLIACGWPKSDKCN